MTAATTSPRSADETPQTAWPPVDPDLAPIADLEGIDQQEIRIATVLNGGVSLAIWMSGVTLELNHLALASQGCDPTSTYAKLLALLQATARVDVIAGTSAGGINGAFLALAIARHRDIELLRDVWKTDGALEKLLRPPMDQNPPSLLDGDGYFLPRIQEALTQVTEATVHEHVATTIGKPPVELILTGTLWDGRVSIFTDDMNVAIAERDYDALFAFSNTAADGAPGNLNDADVISELANAARCTSSFPGAFEPHWVGQDGGALSPQQWPTTAGPANFDNAQYVIDGGVLLNTPVRPALDAIYRQTAHRQVRRVLALVVPDPAVIPTVDLTPAKGPEPEATEVLLSVLTRLRSTDSVSRQLAEIRRRNAEVCLRRDGRARLAQTLAQGATAHGDVGDFARSLWPGYLAERRANAARTISRLVAAGQPNRAPRWSQSELIAALSDPTIRTTFGFVPTGDLPAALAQSGADWTWGQTTVARVSDIANDLLRRALLLSPLSGAHDGPNPIRARVVSCRAELEPTLELIQGYRVSLNSYWLGASGRGGFPLRDAAPVASDANMQALISWLPAVISGWDRQLVAQPTTNGATAAVTANQILYDKAMVIATALFENRDALGSLVTYNDSSAGATEQQAYNALCAQLLANVTDAADVLRRMLLLDVVHLAVAGESTQSDQEVELVQISCTKPESLTGIQMHHFGAFYRESWRVNDWIAGRFDGVQQTIRFALSPQRLQQLSFASADALLNAIGEIAAPADEKFSEWLEQQWRGSRGACSLEVNRVMTGEVDASALDAVATALARRPQLDVLIEDLPALADSIRAEGQDAPVASRSWLARYDAFQAVLGAGGLDNSLVAQHWWDLGEAMTLIGTQKITEDNGSDTFALTVSHSAAVAVAVFTPPARARKLAVVRTAMSAMRGYTLLVWAMVSYLARGNDWAARVVGIAAAVGGSLIAVTILVPAVPLSITLAGVLIVLAAATASALRTRSAKWLAFRVGVVALILAGGLAYWIYHEVHNKHTHLSAAIDKPLVAVAVVLVGVWLGYSKPSARKP